LVDRRFQDVWVGQCAAAVRIREDHGVKDAFNYIIGEKLMVYAQTALTRPEFARELPRFVAEVRRLFSAEEIREHLIRIEREDREAAEAASGEEIDEVARPEDVAAQVERFAAMKELLTAEQLGTS
jgi:hypothetical protein